MTPKAQRPSADQASTVGLQTPNTHSSRLGRTPGCAAGIGKGTTVCMARMCLILRQLATPAQRRNNTPENARHAP